MEISAKYFGANAFTLKARSLIEKKPEDLNLVLSNRDSFDLTSKSQLESFIKEMFMTR